MKALLSIASFIVAGLLIVGLASEIEAFCRVLLFFASGYGIYRFLEECL